MKKTPVFLQVFLDAKGQKTFKSGYIDFIDAKDKEGKDTKELKFMPHEIAKDKYGDPYIKPMNRLARRIKAKQERLYEKKYGPRKKIKESTAGQPFTIDAKIESPKKED